MDCQAVLEAVAARESTAQKDRARKRLRRLPMVYTDSLGEVFRHGYCLAQYSNYGLPNNLATI